MIDASIWAGNMMEAKGCREDMMSLLQVTETKMASLPATVATFVSSGDKRFLFKRVDV